MSQVILTISGMSCGGCVGSVTRALQASAGVARVSVTLEPPEAVVDYDAAATNAEKLAQAVADAGFTVAASRSP